MIEIKNPLKNKNPKDIKIVVGMSGGVDSSVVAAVLKERGYEVIGVTLELWSKESLGLTTESNSQCGSKQDVEDARKVCEMLGIEHIVINKEKDFKKHVVDDFVNTYLSGETPIPCIKCNHRVKLKALIEKSKELKADFVATGHYVNKKFDSELNRNTITTSEEKNKDQSYFLFSLTQDQIDSVIFPLGIIEDKEKTREIASKLGLHVENKKDSQDICFVPDSDYRTIIEINGTQVPKKGNFISIKGEKLGTHNGITNYTVGQRKGIGLSLGYPVYVLAINPKTNEITIGKEKNLLTKEFIVKDPNWLGNSIPDEGIKCKVKVRSTHVPADCTLLPYKDNTIKVILESPEKMVAPGQAAVFYLENTLLGGGWIKNNYN